MTTRRPPRSIQEYLDGPPRVSQRTLADRLGVGQSTISLWLRDERKPSNERLLKLYEITGVPLTTLMKIGRAKRKASDHATPDHDTHDATDDHGARSAHALAY
jgi:transcriptional regulator with XRE-family HTH domain